MARRATLTERIDGDIAAVVEMVAELGEIDRDWDELPEIFLIGWLLDWDQAMGTRLREVGRVKVRGQLSPDQCTRYRSLLADLKCALPTITRRNLYPPPVPLDP